MTNDLTLHTFAAVFVAGPSIYAMLLRLTPQNLSLAVPGCALLAAILGAFSLLATLPLASLVCLWLAWLLAIALFVPTLKQRELPIWVARSSCVVGLLATTKPWFGLTTAKMV